MSSVHEMIDGLISSCATVVRNRDLALDPQYLWRKLQEIEQAHDAAIKEAETAAYQRGYDAAAEDYY